MITIYKEKGNKKSIHSTHLGKMFKGGIEMNEKNEKILVLILFAIGIVFIYLGVTSNNILIAGFGGFSFCNAGIIMGQTEGIMLQKKAGKGNVIRHLHLW